MQFQYKTEQGVALLGTVGRMTDNTDQYMVVYHEEVFRFQESIIFLFRSTCGHPVLTREFAQVVNRMEVKDILLESIIPRRILTADLLSLRNAAAKAVAELIEYTEATLVIEPSTKFKTAMRRLMQVHENPDLLDEHVPPHLKDFMHSQFEDLLNYLRRAPNAKRADQMADRALEALRHYGIKGAPRGELKLN